MPALDGLYRRSGNKFTLLTVSLDDKPSEAVPPFAREHRLTFPLLIADRKALAAWAVRGLPTAFLIDAEGQITHHWIGGLDVPAVENDILAMLNRRP